MATLSALLSFLLVTFALLPSISSQPSPSGCRLILNRLVGRSNSYVYTCDCPQNDRIIPVARAEAQIPSVPPNNAAQASATIRCILRQQTRLLSICERNRRRYDRVATRTLQKCVKAPKTATDRKLKGKFTFSKKRCGASLTTFFGAQTGGVWLCRCRGDGFVVVAGRSAFLTDGSPLGAGEEVEFLRDCTQQFLQEGNRVCRKHPEDFELLALHLLQVCCKRARVTFQKDKFKCAAIVPDDVSPFKVPI